MFRRNAISKILQMFDVWCCGALEAFIPIYHIDLFDVDSGKKHISFGIIENTSNNNFNKNL
jgi:hypothetical protein